MSESVLDQFLKDISEEAHRRGLSLVFAYVDDGAAVVRVEDANPPALGVSVSEHVGTRDKMGG